MIGKNFPKKRKIEVDIPDRYFICKKVMLRNKHANCRQKMN